MSRTSCDQGSAIRTTVGKQEKVNTVDYSRHIFTAATITRSLTMTRLQYSGRSTYRRNHPYVWKVIPCTKNKWSRSQAQEQAVEALKDPEQRNTSQQRAPSMAQEDTEMNRNKVMTSPSRRYVICGNNQAPRALALRKIAHNKLVLSTTDMLPNKSAPEDNIPSKTLPICKFSSAAKRKPPRKQKRTHKVPRSNQTVKRIKLTSIVDTNTSDYDDNDDNAVTELRKQDEEDLRPGTGKEAHPSSTTDSEQWTDSAYRVGKIHRNGATTTRSLVRVEPTSQLCPSLLTRGMACTDPSCRKRHDEEARPICAFFQRMGMCLKGDACPFRHVKMSKIKSSNEAATVTKQSARARFQQFRQSRRQQNPAPSHKYVRKISKKEDGS